MERQPESSLSPRTRRKRAQTESFSVYVVELSDTVGPRPRPGFPNVYVGMTGLDPEQRFANHKRGHKAARVAKNHGLRLLPKLYSDLNPMTWQQAVGMEVALADPYKALGFNVYGGH